MHPFQGGAVGIERDGVDQQKTIDNDLQGTVVTFGFDTAANTAMEALDKLHTTAESHHRVIILEVMGRDAGWIALQAGIAGGADVILIPEIPYDLDVVAEKINARSRRGAKFSIVVVAEGAKPMGEDAVYQPGREIGAVRRSTGRATQDKLPGRSARYGTRSPPARGITFCLRPAAGQPLRGDGGAPGRGGQGGSHGCPGE